MRHATVRRTRLTVMGVAAVAVGVAVSLATDWWFAPAAAWLAAALIYDVWVWIAISRMDAHETRSHAQAEDDGRRTSEVLLISANVASLLAVVLVLAQAEASLKVAAGLLALATVVASWLLVHTVFVLHYARLYYTEPVGGIDFNDESDPDYLDFAYLAFSMGMTYQVSDTGITQRAMRRTALRHSIVSFLFGMFVLATMVNVVLGLAN